MSIRVIAGTAKGRRLESPDGSAIRPTSDRVREAVFNSLVAYDLPVGAIVLDLFAGTGALGIEALSRGAAHVVFVDSNRQSLQLTQANVAHCGFTDQSTFVQRTGEQFLTSSAAVTAGPFDLAFLDPPYDYQTWPELLDIVEADLIVAESPRSLESVVSNISHLEFLRSRTYGGTVVDLIAHRGRDENAQTPRGEST